MNQHIYTRVIYGNLELCNYVNQPIQNQTLFLLVQQDTIIQTNDIGGTTFYTKPHIVFEEKNIKKYSVDGKTLYVQLPPKVPEITPFLFTNCFKQFLIIYNERYEQIDNPKLSEMILNDLEKGVDKHGEICFYTKPYIKIKEFLFDDFMPEKLPVKEYAFEGKTISVQLPRIKLLKEKISTPVDIFDIFS